MFFQMFSFQGIKTLAPRRKKLLITVRRLFKECFFQTHYYFHKFLPFFQTQQNKPLCQNFFFVLSKPGGVDSPEQLRSRSIICQLSSFFNVLTVVTRFWDFWNQVFSQILNRD